MESFILSFMPSWAVGILFCLWVLFSFCLLAFWSYVLIQYINKLRGPWKGYSLRGLQKVIERFALLPDRVKLSINDKELTETNSSIIDPINGCYVHGGKIFIDTRHVRSERGLVSTLLHEICHHNQYLQGRMVLGQRGRYGRRPIEREAFSFEDAWVKKALEIYKKEK